MTAADRARARHLPLAELALAGVTAAAVVSFSRLFESWSYLWPLLLVIAYSHLSTLLLRRRGTSVAVSALVATGGFVLLASWLWFASTTTAGLPDASTWSALTTSLRDSWDAFQELAAPVPVLTGFMVTAAVAVFFAVFLADWAAFRLWSPIESIVPALTLFLFSTLLGSETQRVTSATLFCAATLLYLLAHRVARLETSSGWLTSDVERGSRWLFRAGAGLTAVAVLGGVVLGPRLPGSGDEAVIDFRGADDGGPSSRVTVSPLVDIRGRLVDQSDVEVFRVESPKPAYWRLTALDTFDGEIWRSGGRYGEASGDLGAPTPDAIGSETLPQSYEIDRLGALWLPAAYQPVSVETDGPDARYERASGTLIVDTDLTTSDQLRYDVVSELPAPTAEQLEAASGSLDPGLAGYLELPDAFSPYASEVAREVVATAGAFVAFDKAMALQDFFRDVGPFADDGFDWEYALGERGGHDVDAIDSFLETNRGYCEMYAGTYAAMARAVGLPARVAVGFTWGDVDPENPNLYHVKGKHAHAWPEVWLGDEVGWIAFEPTPGRGAPDMERYNGVSASQTDGTDEGTTGTSTSTTAAASAPSSTTTAPADAEGLEESLDTAPPGAPRTGGGGLPFVLKLGVAALVLLALVAAYVVATLAVAAARRRRRRDRARTPQQSVAVAWEESLENLELVGVVPRPSETHREFAGRATTVLPERGPQLDELAGLADVVSFSVDAVGDGDALRASEAADAIESTVQGRVSRSDAWRHRLHPRRWRRGTTDSTRQTARSSRA